MVKTENPSYWRFAYFGVWYIIFEADGDTADWRRCVRRLKRKGISTWRSLSSLVGAHVFCRRLPIHELQRWCGCRPCIWHRLLWNPQNPWPPRLVWSRTFSGWKSSRRMGPLFYSSSIFRESSTGNNFTQFTRITLKSVEFCTLPLTRIALFLSIATRKPPRMGNANISTKIKDTRNCKTYT